MFYAGEFARGALYSLIANLLALALPIALIVGSKGGNASGGALVVLFYTPVALIVAAVFVLRDNQGWRMAGALSIYPLAVAILFALPLIFR